jgi:hypothetical protein
MATAAENNPVVQPVLKQPEDMCEPWCSTCANELCSQPGYRPYLDLTNGLINGYSTSLPLVSLDFMAYEEGDSPCSFIWKDASCKKTGSNYVTIGINIDLGKQSSTTLTAIGVSDSVIAVLTPVLGLRNGNLPAYCAQNNYSKCHVELSLTGRNELNEKFHYGKATELKGIFNSQKNPDVPNFEDLQLGVRTSIYSNYFMYGAAMLMKKPFWSFIIKGDWPSAIAWLRSVQTNRADDEATIMEKALLPPVAVGGVVSAADSVVSCGTNSTLLTLSGHTGSIQKWQYSTNNTTWNDIPGSTSTTYTAVNIGDDTWFRAVLSGAQNTANSTAKKLYIYPKYRIAGYAKYDNNPNTPLNGLKVLLRKGQDIVDSAVTSAAGYFVFTNKTNGTFGFQIKSAHPGGQWQTWGGVNNTDYLLVNKHIASTQLLPLDPPVVRVTASTKELHPLINSLDANAIRQAAKFPLTGWQYFDIPKWVFSGTTTLNHIDTFELACANVTRDILGLCSGDVNGTYMPSTGVKTLHATSLQLVNRGTLPITPEITFPVRAERDMELGAITLMLDYDPALIEITGVSMPGNVDEQPVWHLAPGIWHLNTLYIGWMSMNPVQVENDEKLLLIHARLTEAFQVSGAKCQVPGAKCQISFALNDNPLSELADGDGNVLYDAKLTIPDAKANGEMVKWRNGENGSISVYPNPAKDVLNVEFVIDDNNVGISHGMSLQLVTLQGIVVARQNLPDVRAGLNKTTMGVSKLPNGAYFLRVESGEVFKTVMVIVNR